MARDLQAMQCDVCAGASVHAGSLCVPTHLSVRSLHIRQRTCGLGHIDNAGLRDPWHLGSLQRRAHGLAKSGADGQIAE